VNEEGPVIATLLLEETEPEETEAEDADDSSSSESQEVSGTSARLATKPEAAEEFELREGQTIRLGRANTNDIPIRNRNVSRFHAVFSASSSGVVLSDLSSLNGTFVNGSRINTPVDISSGDVVTIGDTKISIKLSLGEPGGMDSTHGETQTAQLAAVVVTVLVVDVVGYTNLSESLPPQDVAEMMHTWFQATSEIVRSNDGEVDKYIGDCVMALWKGSYSDAKENALNATRAGFEMLEKTKKMSESGEWIHHATVPWECRVALNTGEALMGTVGGAGKRDFTVLGDTVNVAFRLESIGKQQGTKYILSKATADMVQDEFSLKPLGSVNVAGRSGEIEVFSAV